MVFLATIMLQVCGTDIQVLSSPPSPHYLCGAYLCEYKRQPLNLISATLEKRQHTCDGKQNCWNTDLDEKNCTEELVKLGSGNKIENTRVCNNLCDTLLCEDAGWCESRQLWGRYNETEVDEDGEIITKQQYIPPQKDCKDEWEGTSQCDVTNNTHYTCVRFNTSKKVPLHHYHRCSLFDDPLWHNEPYCHDYLDQTNCTDSNENSPSCQVRGYHATLAERAICNLNIPKPLCDDGIDKECRTFTTCTVHKHQLCDGVQDCRSAGHPTGSHDQASRSRYSPDEDISICRNMTEPRCVRRLGGKKELPIPVSWIQDGVLDCMDGLDEEEGWPYCGSGRSYRIVSKNYSGRCENVYWCSHDGPGFVQLSDLCDGENTCGNENKVCDAAKKSPSVVTKPFEEVRPGRGRRQIHLNYCLKGLNDFRHHCVEKEFKFPNHHVFGLEKKEVVVPMEQQNCNYLYGEHYVYMSCTGSCDSPCPLSTLPSYYSCPGQYLNRVGTLANSSFLSFLTRSSPDSWDSGVFVCDNGKCVDYEKVCNLANDCGDGSDEDPCTNSFKCEETGDYIPVNWEFDGVVNCADLSDECNYNNRTEQYPNSKVQNKRSMSILPNYFVKFVSWFIGITAVLANSVVIVNCLCNLKKCKSMIALANKALVATISFGDLLVGFYMVIIAVHDSFVSREDYCRKQQAWLTGHTCSALGVISTIGTQCSLFAMTTLSLLRMHVIMNPRSIPGRVTWRNSAQIPVWITVIIVVSIVIAVIPVVPQLEDFFVNGMYFVKGLKLFVGLPTKRDFMEIFKAYYGRLKDVTLSWRMIENMAMDMYSHDLNHIDLTESRSQVHFYGNDGVCLFKFFVSPTDPQLIFVWAILTINFTCFTIITIAYSVVGIVNYRSSKKASDRRGSNKSAMSRKTQNMNRKIAIIIATDFICWVPFIITCALHTLQVLDGTNWYAVFSMIVLPINAVINPLLYDDLISNFLNKLGCLKEINIFLSRRLSSSQHYFTEMFLLSSMVHRFGVLFAQDDDLNRHNQPNKASEEVNNKTRQL